MFKTIQPNNSINQNNQNDNTLYDVIIIGSGPAGHTAGIYSSRANLNTLMFEGFMAGGVAAGGQLTTTTEVENFPGFPNGIEGPELMNNIRAQNLNCGTKILTETISKVSLDKAPFELFNESNQKFISKSIIVATGANAKRMYLKGEDLYWQKGISACAVCDGALPIFRNKVIVVIGGGDTACEEAIYLSKFASKVYMLVRRDVLRASKAMQKRAFENAKIEILWNTEALEVLGDGKLLQKIIITNNKTSQQSEIEAAGLFYAIGHQPNTAFLNSQLDLDELGYIITKPGTTQTSKPGVFACGDVQDHIYRQAITAAGSGAMAGLEASRFLEEYENFNK